MRNLLLACTFMLALAGCTAQEDASLALDTYTLMMHDAEETGAGLNFTMTVTGDMAGNSDHIGGHYWSTDVADPTASFGDAAGGCAHVAGGGDLPGTFAVTCDLPEGTWYVFGHVRVTEGEEKFNFWTESREVVVGAMA